MSQLATKYADKGLVVLAPSLDAEDSVKAFKEKHKWGDEVAVLSEARPAAKAYGVKGYPTAFVVGKDGKVVFRGHPMAKDFEKAVEDALK